MNRYLVHYNTLVYYDGPQVIIAVDQLSTKYICSAFDAGCLNDRFLCVSVSPARLNLFLRGQFDLRSLYKEPEEGLYWVDLDKQGYDRIFNNIDVLEIQDSWLPEEGFNFNWEESDEVILNETITKHKAIVHLSLSPPEAQTQSKIKADNLAAFIRQFQNLIKYSYKKTIASLNPTTRKLLDNEDNYSLEVFAFSEGSFNIHMESVASDDLLGYVNVSEALKRIDEIIWPYNVSNYENYIDILKKNKGHLISSYRNLLELIIKNNTPITYKWLTPDAEKPLRRTITKDYAIPTYDILINRVELGTEQKIIVGRVFRVDVHRGTWEIRSDEDEKSYSGKVDPQSKVSLDGITVTTKKYKFACEERIEEYTASGKEIAVLWLVACEEL